MSTIPEAERTQELPTLKKMRRQGGIRWGSAFFGWVTATGMAALLAGLVAVAAAAAGLVNPEAADPAAVRTTAVQTMGLAGAAVLLAIIFVGYYCGGYVAGRMARFSGARQGVAVWLWTLLVAVIGAVIATVTGVVAGPRIDELFPMTGGVLSTAAAAFAVGVLVVTLVGAVLGGIAGMRYHRRVDRDLVTPTT
jgi:hypothetical protein